jgi:hypothetical protein
MASYCRFPQSSTSAHSPFVRMSSALSRERPSSSFENLGSGTTAAFSGAETMSFRYFMKSNLMPSFE